MPRPWEDPSTLPSSQKEASLEMVKVDEPLPSTTNTVEGESDDESGRKRKRREERRQEKHVKNDKHEKRHEKHEKHERHEDRKSTRLNSSHRP